MRILAVTILLLYGCSDSSPPQSTDSKTITNSIGMEFIRVPAGNFTMGSSQEDQLQMMDDFKAATGKPYLDEWHIHIQDELPPHEVSISKDFYIQTTEVTNDQFDIFVTETNYHTSAEIMGGGYYYTNNGWLPLPEADWRHPTGPSSSIDGLGEHPVVQVSWTDANAFLQWLSEKEGKTYGLPTEAQWEYACRGGYEGELYSWGEEMPPDRPVANMQDESFALKYGTDTHYVMGYDDGYADTAPVGSYEANGFGLYDMIGNVWEWTLDWYDETYYEKSPSQDPKGPETGAQRVLRGGSFIYLPSNQRCADRFRGQPEFRTHFVGFRLIMNIGTD